MYYYFSTVPMSHLQVGIRFWHLAAHLCQMSILIASAASRFRIPDTRKQNGVGTFAPGSFAPST